MEQKILCSLGVCPDGEPPSGVKFLVALIFGLAIAVMGIFTGEWAMALGFLIPLGAFIHNRHIKGFDIIEIDKKIIVTKWKKFFGPKKELNSTEFKKTDLKALSINKHKAGKAIQHTFTLTLRNKQSIELVNFKSLWHVEKLEEFLQERLNCKVEKNEQIEL